MNDLYPRTDTKINSAIACLIMPYHTVLNLSNTNITPRARALIQADTRILSHPYRRDERRTTRCRGETSVSPCGVWVAGLGWRELLG